jgi:hypothetical protein
MRVILHISCQIQGTISGLRYAKSGPGQIQYNYFSWYTGFNIQLNVSTSILVICRQFNTRYTQHLLPKCRAQYPVFAILTLVPVKSNIITVLAIQASIFNWTYLWRCWWYIDNSVRFILHIWFRIQSTISGSRYCISGAGKIQYNYISWYSVYNIQFNVSSSTLDICRQFNAHYTSHLLPNATYVLQIRLC